MPSSRARGVTAYCGKERWNAWALATFCVDMTGKCRSSLAGIRFRTHLIGWFMNKRPPK